jgi:hypothetical protein
MILHILITTLVIRWNGSLRRSMVTLKPKRFNWEFENEILYWNFKLKYFLIGTINVNFNPKLYEILKTYTRNLKKSSGRSWTIFVQLWGWKFESVDNRLASEADQINCVGERKNCHLSKKENKLVKKKVWFSSPIKYLSVTTL